MGSEDELQALDAQVAAGQVSIDEYLRRRAALVGSDNPGSAPLPPAAQAAVDRSPAQPPTAPRERAAGPAAPPAFAGQRAPQTWQAAAPVAPQSPTPTANGDGTVAPSAVSPLSPTGPPGSDPARPDPAVGGGRSRDWTPPTAPVTGAARPGKSRTALMAAAAAVVAALVFGAGGFLLGRSGSDSDDSAPKPSTSDSGTVAIAPNPPLGQIDGSVAVAGGLTADVTRKEAVVVSGITTDEEGALGACGAAKGSIQANVSPSWTSHSWLFSCRDGAAAAGAVTALHDYDKVIGLADQKLTVSGAQVTSVTTANGASVRVRYASGADVLSAAVEGATLDDAVAGAEALLKALVKNHPPS